MSDTYLGNGYTNGATPSNPWADYLANRKNRQHEMLMENQRHSNNMELASLQHQQAQDRDKKNFKRGKKESRRDRNWQSEENEKSRQWNTSERKDSQAFQSSERVASSSHDIARIRETAKQDRRSTKTNAQVVRDMAQPTEVGHRSIGSFSVSPSGAQAVFGAPTRAAKTGTRPSQPGKPSAQAPKTATTSATRNPLTREQKDRRNELARNRRAATKTGASGSGPGVVTT